MLSYMAVALPASHACMLEFTKSISKLKDIALKVVDWGMCFGFSVMQLKTSRFS